MSEFRGAGKTRPYQGAAWHYAEHRPAISDDFARMLAAGMGWTAQDRLIDLGAGPGQVAIQLAPYVHDVVAVDPEVDMLAEGERRAVQAGVDNIRFTEGSSDDLGLLGERAHQFRAVTIGSAFHRMSDQDRVLRDLDGYLDARDGAVLLVGHDVGGPVVRRAGEDLASWRDLPPWSAAGQILSQYLDGEPQGPHPQGRHDPFPDILGRSPFSRLRLVRYEYEVVEQPSVEAVLGYHYSLSHVLSRLGDRRAALEADVAERLAEADRSPVRVRMVDSALIGVRPHGDRGRG